VVWPLGEMTIAATQIPATIRKIWHVLVKPERFADECFLEDGYIIAFSKSGTSIKT